MSAQVLNQSSPLQYQTSIPYRSSRFDQTVNRRSFASTMEKTGLVAVFVLGSTALIAGITLVTIVSAGVAVLPMGAATVGTISLLSAGGAAGVVGGCCGLRSMRVNRAAGKVLKAASLIGEEAENLQRIYTQQGSISENLAKKLQALKTATDQLGKTLAKGDKRLQETAKEAKLTQKEQEKIEKNIQQIKTLTIHLSGVLDKLNHTTISTKEMRKLVKTMEKLIKTIEKFHKRLDKVFPGIEQSLKEHNTVLQGLRKDLSLLQETAKQSLVGSYPSMDLEDTVQSIELRMK